MIQIMTQLRDQIQKFRDFMRPRRSRNYQASYGPAIIASQMEESASRTAENRRMFELEALKVLETFEMEGSHNSYDPDQLLSLRVWNDFLQKKVKEMKSITGSTPELPEMNRLILKDFDVIGAINQMTINDPHLKRPLDQARRESLFRALSLLLKSEALDDSNAVATLSQFCRYHPVIDSRDELFEAAVSPEQHFSQSTLVTTVCQPPGDIQRNTQQTDEGPVESGVSFGPFSSQSPSSLPGYQPPSGTQGNTEQTDEGPVESGVSFGPPSSQSPSSLPGYQSPSGTQGNTAQTDEAYVEAGVSFDSSSSQSTSTLPDYQPQNILQWTERPGEEQAYTIYLKELGDSEGFLPAYTPTQLSYTPSRWRVVAQYRGLSSSGEAISIKAAKHLASRGLWMQLRG
ncbi:hypothetical protein PENCOP_c005G03927 [Penicillium coprophilum]|uniref:DRBM domain-containing protein n=1 Tax=Penicillium coprophilum TaxID=36646 RepID=A0A1V6USI2_9EURO|nr:hypothetical protein PENCOP_c005G03927 [Penicillium coprophilum]